MSIEVAHPVNNEFLATAHDNSGMTTMEWWHMPEPVKITAVAPVKKKQIKEKRVVKHYYELLEESYDKGIFNRRHTNGKSRNEYDLNHLQNSYSCPILCVAELLGWIKSNEDSVKINISHHPLAAKMDKVKYVVTYKGELSCPICGSDYGKFRNEPEYAQHIASCHEFNNRKVAKILREQLYSNKELPKEKEKEPELKVSWTVKGLKQEQTQWDTELDRLKAIEEASTYIRRHVAHFEKGFS